MNHERPDLGWVWLGALGCFILAGSTGVLFRFGLLNGFPAGLQLVDVRHAHSHLMYFGWATPVLMALIVTQLPKVTGGSLTIHTRFRAIIGLTLVLALLAYPPFLLFGYRLADIGGRQLPLSVMAASLNILAWYVFIGLYIHATWRLPRRLPLRLWDASLAFLALASLGAWGRGALVAVGVEDPFWQAAMVHLFLDFFSDGWFLLALLGVAYSSLSAAPEVRQRWGTRLLILGLPGTFLLGVPVNLVSGGLRLLAGAGGIAVSLGMMLHWRSLWGRMEGLWRMPLIFLGVKSLAELGVSLPPVARRTEAAGLRISYLHWYLLGFVSLGLIAAARHVWGRRLTQGATGMAMAVALLLASLLLVTPLWPAGWSGRWTLQLAAWIAALPPVLALAMLLSGLVNTAFCPKTSPTAAGSGHPETSRSTP